MSGVARLLWIEVRRNQGLWLFPLVAALTVWTTINILPSGPWLWPQISVFMRQALLLVLPLVAGLSAWNAGRNRRRGMEELLAATPRSPASRDLVTWGAAATWYGLAYALAAVIILLSAFVGGAWGWPVLWPELLGFLDECCMDSIRDRKGAIRLLFPDQRSTGWPDTTIPHVSPPRKRP